MDEDEDRHGPWNKAEQRYEDGCEWDAPHDPGGSRWTQEGMMTDYRDRIGAAVEMARRESGGFLSHYVLVDAMNQLFNELLEEEKHE